MIFSKGIRKPVTAIGREGSAECRIVDRADGRMTAGEVVDRSVALDRHLDPDRDHPFAAGWVAVDEVDRLPLAIGQCGDALAHRTFDVILHGG
jgi:hypothetical protein